MENYSKLDSKPFRRCGNTDFEFDPTATEVAILDRSGRAVWKKTKGDAVLPIRWNGNDFAGQTVQTGDYICKIVYPNDRIAYLPFVFMKKA